MVVCYHFQRGNCRFGASCRFEHVNPNYDSYYQTNDSSQYQGDRYHYVKPSAAISQPAKNNQIDAGQIFDVVAADTMVAVNGGQWPFSSYGPVKGYQNIIGFEDISPEELRYIMYTAKESGNVDDCKRHFNELLQMENMKRTLLMTPSVEADAAIQSIYRGEDQQPLNPIATVAFHQSQPTLNRTPAESHTASIFGGSSSTGSVFGTPSLATPFPTSANTTSIFQNNASAGSVSANVFGVGSGGSVFGGGSSSLFGGGGAAVQSSGSVFGGAPSGLFSAAAAAVTQQAAGGFFGSAATQPAPAQQTAGLLFGATPTQPPSGLFAAAASVAPSNIFGGLSAAQPNAFGPASHTASIFGAAKQTTAPTAAFGGFQSGNEPLAKSNVPSSPFQQASDVSGSIYTPLSELDDEEKAAFQAKTFTIGKIPIRPPPRELCF